MDESRRSFLKIAGASVVGAGCCVPVLSALARSPGGGHGGREPGEEHRWALVVETAKCQAKNGCRACTEVCHGEHNVPTIPNQGANQRHQVEWIWPVPYHNAFPEQQHHEFDKEPGENDPVVVLCNHCKNPPCVRVCPTQATFKRQRDGIVLMDMHRCIGCRYCMAACPYGARSFNFLDPSAYINDGKPHDRFPQRTKGVVEKCNFCAELLAKQLSGPKPQTPEPYCVKACREAGHDALHFGDLYDDSSSVRKLLESQHTIRRKPNLGTMPSVFYIL